MTVLVIFLVAAGVGAILLLVTADVWLAALPTRLDALLVRMGLWHLVGGAVTRIETRMAEKRRRQRTESGPG